MNLLRKEWALFQGQTREFRFLAGALVAYAFALPVINTFAGAFILRTTGTIQAVVLYHLFGYSLILPVSVLNGFLVQRCSPARMLAAGGILYILALLVLSSLPGTLAGILVAGTLTGAATALFWTSRGYLILVTTKDADRNYFLGIESAAFTLCSVAVSAAAGWFITLLPRETSLTAAHAYLIVKLCALLFALLCAALILKGRYPLPPRSRFLFLRFLPEWNRFLLLDVVKGSSQVLQFILPAVLILHVTHKGENWLGSFQSIDALVSGICMYILGRRLPPQKRAAAFSLGVAIYAVAALFNAAFFTPAAILLFLTSMLLITPLTEIAYTAIQLQTTDYAVAKENRNPFAYIVSHEAALYIGRLFTCLLFLALCRLLDPTLTLRIVIVTIAMLQLLIIPLSHSITKNVAGGQRNL